MFILGEKLNTLKHPEISFPRDVAVSGDLLASVDAAGVKLFEIE